MSNFEAILFPFQQRLLLDIKLLSTLNFKEQLAKVIGSTRPSSRHESGH